MNETRSEMKDDKIGAVPFTVWEGVPLHKEIFGDVEVVAGTTVPSEDGRSVLILHAEGAMEATRLLTHDDGETCGIAISLDGEAATALADALEYAARILRQKAIENHPARA